MAIISQVNSLIYDIGLRITISLRAVTSAGLPTPAVEMSGNVSPNSTKPIDFAVRAVPCASSESF